MLTNQVNDKQSSVLASALKEIGKRVNSLRTAPAPKIDPIIERLSDELNSQFSSLLDCIYVKPERFTAPAHLAVFKKFANHAELEEPKADLSISNAPHSIYLYPTLYLDQVLSSHDVPVIKILPYLLAAYYINYPQNRILPPDPTPQKYGLTGEDILFGSVDSQNALPPNYNATLESFCRKFSLEALLPRFFASKRKGYSKNVQGLSNTPELIAVLNSDLTKVKAGQLVSFEMTSLHYQKVLEAYIYSLCVFACSSIEDISEEIDYKLSIDLFNAHTLAFESIYSVGSKLCLKDFFEPDTYKAYLTFFDPEDKSSSPAEDLPTNFPFSLEFLKLSSSTTEDELAQKAPLMLCIALHPSQYLAFRNEKMLEDSLRNHISPVSKLGKSLGLDDED